MVAKQNAIVNKDKIQSQTVLVNGLNNNPGSKSGELGISIHSNLSLTAGINDRIFCLSVVKAQLVGLKWYFPVTTFPNAPLHSPLRLKGP